MQWKWGNALLSASIVVGASLATPVLGGEYRSDWKPLARVNPKAPVQILLINEAGETVRYTLMGHTDSRAIPTGQKMQLNKVPLPAYFGINPARDRAYMRYNVSVNDNLVKIRILPAKVAGDRAFEIDKTGAIYAY